MDIIFVSRNGVEHYKSFEEVPYKVSGYNEDMSVAREKGIIAHREELDNKPLYWGWIGPMWDGDRYRYETREVYDVLSM